jgi:ribosomal protein S18 acetylase RimI-like enzyme
MTILPAISSDLAKILSLQCLAYQSEAILLQNFSIPPLLQTLEELRVEFQNGTILKAVEDGEIIGSVRGCEKDHTLYIGKLIVHPDYRGRGIGTQLLQAIEDAYPGDRYELFTSAKSEKNIRLYERQGYRRFAEKQVSPELRFIYLEKPAVAKQADRNIAS